MEIRDIMTEGCTTLAPGDTLKRAAEMMKSEDIGILPVAENDKLIGMISDRDIVIRAVADGRAADSSIGEFMSDKVYYCFDDQTADDVAHNMAELQVRRLPVVNREKRLVGIVSLGDLAAKGAPAKAKKALEGVSQNT